MDNKNVAPLAGGTTRTFEDIAARAGWDAEHQVAVLLDYIDNQQDDDALIEHAERTAAEEPADANEAGIERRAGTHVERLGPPSAAYVAEHPWCGWRIAFAADSEADTVSSFGFADRIMGINVLLTTADGRSRPVSILDIQFDMPSDDPESCQRGIEVTELETEHYEPMNPERRELVRYEDIREIVVF